MDYYIDLHHLSLITITFPQSELKLEVVHFMRHKHNFQEGENVPSNFTFLFSLKHLNVETFACGRVLL